MGSNPIPSAKEGSWRNGNATALQAVESRFESTSPHVRAWVAKHG